MTDYLTVAEVLAIHGDLIETYGGTHGVRDLGQLESALYRPQTGYYSDILAEAAALWESLSQNHPFIDGNKRTAFACCRVFLIMNDVELCATETETIDFLLPLYDAKEFKYEIIENWLRETCK